MKILIRLTVLAGLLCHASWSSAAVTTSKSVKSGKTFGIFANYKWIDEGTGEDYAFVGGDAGAMDPKVNLWSGGSTGIPVFPPSVDDGEMHGQTGGWTSLSASPSMDWSAYSGGTMKLHLCVSDDKPLKIAFKSEDHRIGEWSVKSFLEK